MLNKCVVIYGSGASYASGYKVNISSDESNKIEMPLLDRGFFKNKSVKNLISSKYPAINKFIEFYFDEQKDIGLEEVWAAVDINSKHIKLGTYDWSEENKQYQLEFPDRYPFDDTTSDLMKYKFLGDCGRDLRNVIYDTFSNFILDNSFNNYLKLHSYLKKQTKFLGYITFNYDLILEDAIEKNNDQIFYIDSKKDMNNIGIINGKYLIIKLHGSLNWKFEFDRIFMLGNIEIKKEAIRPDYSKTYYVQPAIIPPTIFKQEINLDIGPKDQISRILIYQWKAAIRLLLEADKIIFIGYSFPPTDFHVERIFRIAMMYRKSKSKKTSILYCGGKSNNSCKNEDKKKKKLKEKLQKIFNIDENDIVIKNDFKVLCNSRDLENFLR